jgi:hypothetical protein
MFTNMRLCSHCTAPAACAAPRCPGCGAPLPVAASLGAPVRSGARGPRGASQARAAASGRAAGRAREGGRPSLVLLWRALFHGSTP